VRPDSWEARVDEIGSHVAPLLERRRAA
jgi:hypothetical protein